MEGVLDKISLVPLELDIRDLNIVYEADDLIKDLVLGLTEGSKVERSVDTGIRSSCASFSPPSHRGKYCSRS